MKNNKLTIIKIMGAVLLIMLLGLVMVSCAKEVVTYCPFCGKANIKEISEYDPNTGYTNIHYECTNSECGKKFGAGKL